MFPTLPIGPGVGKYLSTAESFALGMDANWTPTGVRSQLLVGVSGLFCPV